MKLTPQLSKRLKTTYGDWAVITGATSGIGRELAFRVCEAGLNLIAVGRGEKSLQNLKLEITTRFGVQCETLQADLGTDQWIRVTQKSNSRKVGLFIASAGFGTSGTFIGNSIETEAEMLRVNCEALLKLTHHFAKHFSCQKRGGIILMSSMVAFQGVPFSSNYAATKAYVQSLAEGLYHELKPYGVDVLAAAPGPVGSRFGERANMNMGNPMQPEEISLPILKALGKKPTVLPGRLTKILVYALRTLPRWGKVRIMKQVMGGMTKHQGILPKTHMEGPLG